MFQPKAGRYITVFTWLLLGTSCRAYTAIIGDSMFASVSSNMADLLRQYSNGADITNRASFGASFRRQTTEGVFAVIPDEYNDLIGSQGVPSTIIMDGGGNDAIFNIAVCGELSDDCKRIIEEAAEVASGMLRRMQTDAAEVASGMFRRMQADGVRHVIFLGYFYILGMNAAIDYGAGRMRAVCESSPIECHFADVRGLTVPVGGDGIHPTPEGYESLAGALWDIKLQYQVPV